MSGFSALLKKYPSITTYNHVYVKPATDNREIFFK